MDTFLEKVKQALSSEELDRRCMVKNFHLIKVILPTAHMEALIERCRTPLQVNFKDGVSIPVTMFSVPVEEDPHAHHIKYVIEGDLIYEDTINLALDIIIKKKVDVVRVMQKGNVEDYNNNLQHSQGREDLTEQEFKLIWRLCL